jgi:hypothetical protein
MKQSIKPDRGGGRELRCLPRRLAAISPVSLQKLFFLAEHSGCIKISAYSAGYA